MPETKKQNTLILVLLFLVFALFSGLVGYFLGNIAPLANLKLTKPSPSPKDIAEITPQTSPIATEKPQPQESPKAMPSSETKAIKTTKTETINNAYQHDFKFDHPEDWKVDVDHGDFSTGVTISKGDFKILIAQGDMGSARCVYSDEPDYSNPEGPHVKYVEYVQFQSAGGLFRRSQYPAQGTYTICSKRQAQPFFNAYSTVGFIKYQTPIFPTEEQLAELDGIVKTMVAL